jgi:prophage tail gpP-like protein
VTSSKLRIASDMLISTVDFSKDGSGEITTMRVVRPDAFEPDPTARVKG